MSNVTYRSLQIENSEDFDLSQSDEHAEEMETRPKEKARNLVGFWLLGLCNNFAYVIMLSAAHDILETKTDLKNITSNGTQDVTVQVTRENETYLECNQIGTGAILLADILPSLFIKMTAPLYFQYFGYRLKVVVVSLLGLGSFIIVALAQHVVLSLVGVVCASLGSGLGEVTFLAYSSFFNRNVVSTWSSGTGAAGLFGALIYAGLTSLGVAPRTALYMMTFVPAVLLIVFLFLVKKPDKEELITENAETILDSSYYTDDSETLLKTPASPEHRFTWREKARLIKPLLKFMIPLSIVYFAEYFINQGLHEILYFNGIWLTPQEQYRWYQVDYQMGVFISRSSVNLFQISKIWILPIIQSGNLILLLCQIFYQFIPSIWIVFAIILFEGLLGGAAYVNTFYKMSKDIKAEHREYSMSVATVADTMGIAIAGGIAIPSHNAICGLKIKMH